MLTVITAQNVDDHAETMDAIWRFRHRQFVERLGWQELRSRDGRERDEFDTDDAIHLAVRRGGDVIGYSRLLRTSGPHLLRDIYPHLLDGQSWPQARDVYEWTRCISDESAGHVGAVQASHLLITGVLEFCLAAEIRGLIVETHPKLVTWMLETGYEVQTLAAPQTINNVPVVAVYIEMTAKALARHHALFSIRDSVLDIDNDLVNPVTGFGRLRPFSKASQPQLDNSPFLPEVDFAAMRERSGPMAN